MVWCFIALYGGPQVSRQKFEVSTAQLKKKYVDIYFLLATEVLGK